MTISQGMTYGLAAALLALSDGTEPTPYLEVKANRDFVLAGLLVVVAAFADAPARSAALLVGTIAPLADAFTVSRHGEASATAIHLGTAAYALVATGLARSGR